MPNDFSHLFHQSSKDARARGAVNIPASSNEWPEEWRTTYFKSYPRLKRIPLTNTKPLGTLGDAFFNRETRRDFDKTPIDIATLSGILRYSCGIVSNTGGSNHRAQASGGARYPIEMYAFVFVGTPDIPAGIYHYNVKEHTLESLWEREFDDAAIANLFVYPWTQQASCVLVMTSVFGRSQAKYGERGYRYILLEAGHIGQNVYLNAAAFGLKCCALGGTFDEQVEKILDIDGVTESVVYAVALG